MLVSAIQWIGIKEYKQKLRSLADARTKFAKEYLDVIGELTLRMIRQAAPKDTGEYANSWKIIQKGAKFIIIDTDQQDLFNWLENGTQPHEIRADKAKALSLPFGYAKSVMHIGTQPQPHIIHVVKALDKIMKDVMNSQMKKHNKLFRHMNYGMPNSRNIHKTVGLTGTKVSSLRGRGKITMVRGRTGRKQFKRRLGRRRRTGQWIKSASAE